ncbi:RNA polymerase sigma-70 factor (ECF subfamily) [Haloferula luteola]|uniref:RNA polymerase sigma-70 factor (ECF subfamily) n=1 Tax=Haloferula luteola TaxID=595692 RepID=A0A840VGJ9_9BACT|nr:sigma-70 family RNA polymerase sigma factor [Haloferula luteola]MBB5351911.1 RNA polymerase sigma-70 factor (ECF subfamily) [Haloferula luteola]
MSEFEELVDAHYEALFRFALSLSKNRETAADLVQQTFCIWAQKGDQLRDRSKAKTWLFTTLHREFLSLARRRRRYADGELTEEIIERTGAEEDDSERQIDGQRALELLGELDETFRGPITLFYLQQHSYKEIAEILGIPIGTVMSRISRAKDMLKRRMTQEPSSAPKNILQLQPEHLRKHHG